MRCIPLMVLLLAGCGDTKNTTDADTATSDTTTTDTTVTDTTVTDTTTADTTIDTPPPPPATCDVPVEAVDTTVSDRTVGDGSAESCTEEAFEEALNAGGIITFDCGSDPVTITLTSEKYVVQDTVIDGDGIVTLSGGGTTRILNMDTGDFTATSPLLTVQNLTFENARATGTEIPLGIDVDGGGGAIFYRGGSVTVIDCLFTNNRAAQQGPDVAGGAIYGIGVGETVVVGSRFIGNSAANGGAIGALHTAITLVNSTLTGNTATGEGANWVDEFGNQQGHGGNGGAIVMDGSGRTLEICGCDISDNEAGAHGSALFRTGYETEPTIINLSTFDSNSIREPSDPDLGCSGGLYIQGTAVTLTNSTISSNSARSFAGVWILGHGSAPAVANLTNVTIAGNWTFPVDPFTERGIGAGLIIGDNTTGLVLNCTIADNSAQFASGIANVSPLGVRNTIIANNADNEWTPLNCTGSSYDDPPGSGSDNIQWPEDIHDRDMECTPSILYADPLLDPLADNGGTTMTMAPGSSSPAIDAGHDCPATDQRGEPRADPCTIGAYELP